MKLFYREKNGVKLTEKGKELFEMVNKSISSFDFAEKVIKEKNDLPPALQFPSRQQVKFTLPPRKENQQGRANTPISNVLKQNLNSILTSCEYFSSQIYS